MSRLPVALTALVALAILASLAPAAAAEVEGPCTARVNGVSLADRGSSKPGEAIAVVPGTDVLIEFSAQQPVRSWEIVLHLGPISLPASQGSVTGSGTTARDTIDLADYDWLGAGLYRLTGEVTLADGSTCTGSVLLDLGVNPLNTVLGATSAASAALSLVGVGAIAAVVSRP